MVKLFFLAFCFNVIVSSNQTTKLTNSAVTTVFMHISLTQQQTFMIHLECQSRVFNMQSGICCLALHQMYLNPHPVSAASKNGMANYRRQSNAIIRCAGPMLSPILDHVAAQPATNESYKHSSFMHTDPVHFGTRHISQKVMQCVPQRTFKSDKISFHWTTTTNCTVFCASACLALKRTSDTPA